MSASRSEAPTPCRDLERSRCRASPTRTTSLSNCFPARATRSRRLTRNAVDHRLPRRTADDRLEHEHGSDGRRSDDPSTDGRHRSRDRSARRAACSRDETDRCSRSSSSASARALSETMSPLRCEGDDGATRSAPSPEACSHRMPATIAAHTDAAKTRRSNRDARSTQRVAGEDAGEPYDQRSRRAASHGLLPGAAGSDCVTPSSRTTSGVSSLRRHRRNASKARPRRPRR